MTLSDDGWSGTNFKRPGFMEMITDIEAGLIGMVIVKDMSRFGRNYLEVGMYTEIRFPELGVRFIAINDGVDSQDMMSNDFTPFRNIMKNKCRLGRVAECLEPHDAQGEICMFLSYSFSAYVE